MSDDGSGWYSLPPGVEQRAAGPSLATGADETPVAGEDAFMAKCREMAASIQGDAKLLREQLTLAAHVGLVWRGDYEEGFIDEAGRPLVSRVMLFQLPGHKKGEDGFVIYTGFLDEETPPLP